MIFQTRQPILRTQSVAGYWDLSGLALIWRTASFSGSEELMQVAVIVTFITFLLAEEEMR